jgi:hypothetical protein
MRKITSLLTAAMLAAVLVPGIASAQEGDQEAVARVFHCGLVTAYSPPEHTREDGISVHQSESSVTVGERTFAIAEGAINRVRPVVGEGTCLDGHLNASGALVGYWGFPMPQSCMVGDIARYDPATATRDGVLQLDSASSPPYTADSYIFRIPAGTVLPADVADSKKQYCFYFGLDSEGRAIVTRVEDHTTPPEPASPPGGSDTGTGTTGTPPTTAPRQLPSTSTR